MAANTLPPRFGVHCQPVEQPVTCRLDQAGQVVCITPFTLAGAMAPVTLAGALVQQNAEALFGVTLTQLVRPGAPVMYGSFTSNVDMRSGAPAFGTPEYARAAMIGQVNLGKKRM